MCDFNVTCEVSMFSHKKSFVSLHNSLLQLWGQYYREVKANPDGTDHQNIRNFMKSGKYRDIDVWICFFLFQ